MNNKLKNKFKKKYFLLIHYFTKWICGKLTGNYGYSETWDFFFNWRHLPGGPKAEQQRRRQQHPRGGTQANLQTGADQPGYHVR